MGPPVSPRVTLQEEYLGSEGSEEVSGYIHVCVYVCVCVCVHTCMRAYTCAMLCKNPPLPPPAYTFYPYPIMNRLYLLNNLAST